MTRRVGFGDDDKPEGSSIADQAVERHRRLARAKADARAEAHKDSAHARKPRGQWLGVVIMCVWLCLWTGGILLAAGQVLVNPQEVFLWVWLGAAILAWLLVARSIFRKIRGAVTDIENAP